MPENQSKSRRIVEQCPKTRTGGQRQCEKRTSVVRHEAVHRKAAEGTNREGHGNLEGRRIIEGIRTTAQGSQRGPAFDYRLRFRHSHDGTGFGSTHKPILASRASPCNPSNTVSSERIPPIHQHHALDRVSIDRTKCSARLDKTRVGSDAENHLNASSDWRMSTNTPPS